MKLSDLEDYLSDFLKIEQFSDYCPNGVQVAAEAEVNKIMTGVTASEALIDEAIAQKANAILVHHGYFWKGEDPCIRGIKKNRISKLLRHDIALLAYHLPLDCHPLVGNNVQLLAILCQHLAHEVIGALSLHQGHALGLVCELKEALPIGAFTANAKRVLSKEVMLLGPADKQVKRIGICTGAAQNMFEAAIAEHHIDLFITGEVSEPNFHLANEYQVAFLALGHHASECYGIQALGMHLSKTFALQHAFVDLVNPA